MFENIGTNAGDKTIEDKFFEQEVKMNLYAFMRQFGYGVFYSLLKLKEQQRLERRRQERRRKEQQRLERRRKE